MFRPASSTVGAFTHKVAGSYTPYPDWCDKQNERTLSILSQAQTAMQFKATDGQTPEWLTVYDAASAEVIKSTEYAQMRDSAYEIDSATVSRLPVLQRRTYTLIRESVAKHYALPAKYILLVVWSVPAHLDEEYNKWYDEEHMAEVAQTPGWIRGRRYKLIGSQDIASRPGPPVYNYLIMFDWDNGDYWEYIEQKQPTPWTRRMLAAGEGLEIRRYELYRDFEVS